MIRSLLALFITLSVSISVTAGENRSAWTDPEYWEFLGSLSIPVSALRDALAADINVLLASRTPQNPESLAAILAERLAAGYRNSGFPEVVVSSEVVPERQQIVLTVKEGPHYRNGDVRVEGANTIPVEELITGLTEGTGPKDAFLRWSLPPEQGGVKSWFKASGEPTQKDAAVWKKGASTSFDGSLERTVKSTAVLILQRLGYLEPAIVVQLEPQADGRTTVVVRIEDEGALASLGEIEVHGNTINTTEQILTYLDIKPGQALDTDSASRWQWKLQESARFYEAKVEVTPPLFGAGPSRLDIRVAEIPDQPTLSEPVTPLQEASIRAARWMTGPKQEDWQLRLSVKLDDATLKNLPWAWQGAKMLQSRWTFSTAEKAAIIELDIRDEHDQSIWAANVHLGEGQLQFLNLTRKVKVSCPSVGRQLYMTAHSTVNKPDEKGLSSRIAFGVGIHNRTDNELPLRFETIVSPASILVETLKPASKTTLENGLLRMQGDYCIGEFDAETGRLLKFHVDIDSGWLVSTLQAEAGLYRQRLQEQTPAYKACREAVWEDGRVTNLFIFLLDSWTELAGEGSAKQEQTVALVRRLLNAGVFHAIDEQLRRLDGDDETAAISFSIPAPDHKGPVHPLAWIKPLLHYAFAGYGKVFPRETGAWVAGREAVLALVGGKKGAVPPARVVEVLDQADAGPISFLLATEMFRFVSPYHHYVLANATVDRLDSPALHSDLQVFTDERSAVGKVVLATAAALRDASPDDLAVVAGWMTKAQYDDVLRPAFRELSRRKDEPLSQVLPDVLEQIYPALIRPLVVAELHRLEVPAQAANAQPILKPPALQDTPFDRLEQNRKVPEPPGDISKQQFLPKRD